MRGRQGWAPPNSQFGRPGAFPDDGIGIQGKAVWHQDAADGFAALIRAFVEVGRCFPPPQSITGFAQPVEDAADASASVERFLLLLIQTVIKRLKLRLDCLQTGNLGLRRLFGKRH